jgi:hydroxyethylthiazole kinase-like uncharacterized protein yjeF
MTCLTPLYSTDQIRALEMAAFQREPSYAVMTRAGHAAAKWLDAVAPGGGTLLFVAGPGNNGGDALVAATRLHRLGRSVQVWLLGEPDALPEDAHRAWQDAIGAQVPIELLQRLAYGSTSDSEPLPTFPPRLSGIVDGLLGIGLSRPVSDQMAVVIKALNQSPVPRFALDVPSGLHADTGNVTTVAIRADATITFLGAKPGLFTSAGRDYAGDVIVDTIGVELDKITPSGFLNSPTAFAHVIPRRLHSTHKGTFGSVAVIGGATGMVGAPVLSARAALRTGAGRVRIGWLADEMPTHDVLYPELMVSAASQIDHAAMQAIVLGPGMGQTPAAHSCWNTLMTSPNRTARCVLDADALNLLAQHTGTPVLRHDDVLTPHPLEAARLLSSSVTAIQSDRVAAARDLSARYGAIVILKGSGTIIAGPDGRFVINPNGNASLATAGTGDVLAGITGALLAQGMPSWEAALAAVWLHGAAADRLVAQGSGLVGLAAGDLAATVRTLYQELIGETCARDL